MNELRRLRIDARIKRDQAIVNARREYAATIRNIVSKEKAAKLKGPLVQPVARAVEIVIPNDRAFTVRDILDALELIDSKRHWQITSVFTHLTKLRNMGVIHRLRRSGLGKVAVYRVNTTEREELRIIELVEKVLAGRSLTLTEIAVGVIENGYKGNMKPRVLRGWIATKMRKSGMFAQHGAKRRWSVLAETVDIDNCTGVDFMPQNR